MPALETKPMHFKCHQVCFSADDSTVITREGSSYLTHSFPPNVEGLWETERFLFLSHNTSFSLYHPATDVRSENVGRVTINLLVLKCPMESP